MSKRLTIRAARLASGLTQAELAKQLGLKSASTITMWEKGTRNPPSTMLPQLADLLHCSIDELFSQDPEDSRSSA